VAVRTHWARVLVQSFGPDGKEAVALRATFARLTACAKGEVLRVVKLGSQISGAGASACSSGRIFQVDVFRRADRAGAGIGVFTPFLGNASDSAGRARSATKMANTTRRRIFATRHLQPEKVLRRSIGSRGERRSRTRCWADKFPGFRSMAANLIQRERLFRPVCVAPLP